MFTGPWTKVVIKREVLNVNNKSVMIHFLGPQTMENITI